MFSKRACFFSQMIALLLAGGCGGRAKQHDGDEPADVPDSSHSVPRPDSGKLDERDSGPIVTDASSMPAGCRQTPGQGGLFFLTFSPKPFPSKPNLMIAGIEFVGNGAMQFTLQSVDYSNTALVGTPIVTEPFALRNDGFFRTGQLYLDVPGEANCALPDTALQVQVTLEGGQICDDTQFACGVVNGTVLGLGVDLNGSTFTLQKIESDVKPAPVLNCERTGPVERCK
jgi:hypothetical protein